MLRLIVVGKSSRVVAEEMVLSIRTVERHITGIYGKINARGRADATAYGGEAGPGARLGGKQLTRDQSK